MNLTSRDGLKIKIRNLGRRIKKYNKKLLGRRKIKIKNQNKKPLETAASSRDSVSITLFFVMYWIVWNRVVIYSFVWSRLFIMKMILDEWNFLKDNLLLYFNQSHLCERPPCPFDGHLALVEHKVIMLFSQNL